MKILAACAKCKAQYDASTHKPGDVMWCRCGATIVIAKPRVHDAKLVRCASCGASRGQSGTHCDFCSARFSMSDKGLGMMCPACFCRLPLEAKFCVECGVKIDPCKELPAVVELPCPRCQTNLKRRKIDALDLSECGNCGGIWLPLAMFESICDDAEIRKSAGKAARRTANGRARVELTPEAKVKYAPCPVCKNLMNRGNFCKISGVVIETCKQCGTWLDDQELNQIIRFIEDGGLAKARECEARDLAHSEKMRTKLKRKLTSSQALSIGGLAENSPGITGFLFGLKDKDAK